MIAYALSQGPDAVIEFPLDQDGLPEYDAALPALVLGILPVGLKGLVIAGLLAALMSSLSSVFNTCSTLFTIDIYKKYFPQSSETSLVRVRQTATLVLVVFGLIWILAMQAMNDGGLFQYLQSVKAYISTPIAAVFLLGIFSRRLNAYGAMAALITGFGLGILRLALEASGVTTTGNTLLNLYANSNLLHFAIFLFMVCSAVLVLASLVSPPQPLDQIKDLTWYINGYRREYAIVKPGLIVLSVLLLLCIAGL